MGLFVLITFAWSWLFWLPGVLNTAGWVELPGALPSILGNLALFGPAIAGFILSFRRGGRTGARALWKRGWDWRFEQRWLLPIILLPAAITATLILLMRLAGETVHWEHAAPPDPLDRPLYLDL